MINFKNGYGKFGHASPHILIYKKLKQYRISIERTFALVKENRYFMEISNRYKGIDNVTIHAVEHDIALTQDIIFDYMKTGKLSPVVKILAQRARPWVTPGRGKSALPPEGARKVVPMFLVIEQIFLF